MRRIGVSSIAGFELEPVCATYTIARGAGAAGGELIIGEGRAREAPDVAQGALI